MGQSLKIILSGQKYFAEMVFEMLRSEGHEIVAVVCPLDDQRIGSAARKWEIPIIPAGTLEAEKVPEVDLGITAHSFDYIGKRTRYRPRHGWIGYHPSLLPRHRGRASVEWAIRMRDAITGGTVFQLNAGIDRGDIIVQDWCHVDPALFSMNPKEAASVLWRETLQGIGVDLLRKACDQLSRGQLHKEPQDHRFSTWEPSTEVRDIYRPDGLLLPEKCEINWPLK